MQEPVPLTDYLNAPSQDYSCADLTGTCLTCLSMAGFQSLQYSTCSCQQAQPMVKQSDSTGSIGLEGTGTCLLCASTFSAVLVLWPCTLRHAHQVVGPDQVEPCPSSPCGQQEHLTHAAAVEVVHYGLPFSHAGAAINAHSAPAAARSNRHTPSPHFIATMTVPAVILSAAAFNACLLLML